MQTQQTVRVKLSTYRISAVHMMEGYDAEFNVLALDAGEALDKVESKGVFAAVDATLITRN